MVKFLGGEEMSVLLKDDTGVPIPQYMTNDGSGFEAIKGANGAYNVVAPTVVDAVEALAGIATNILAVATQQKELLESINTNLVNGDEVGY